MPSVHRCCGGSHELPGKENRALAPWQERWKPPRGERRAGRRSWCGGSGPDGVSPTPCMTNSSGAAAKPARPPCRYLPPQPLLPGRMFAVMLLREWTYVHSGGVADQPREIARITGEHHCRASVPGSGRDRTIGINHGQPPKHPVDRRAARCRAHQLCDHRSRDTDPAT